MSEIEPDLELDGSEPKPRNWVGPFPSCFASALCVLGPDGNGTSWRAQTMVPPHIVCHPEKTLRPKKGARTSPGSMAREQQKFAKPSLLTPGPALSSVDCLKPASVSSPVCHPTVFAPKLRIFKRWDPLQWGFPHLLLYLVPGPLPGPGVQHGAHVLAAGRLDRKTASVAL